MTNNPTARKVRLPMSLAMRLTIGRLVLGLLSVVLLWAMLEDMITVQASGQQSVVPGVMMCWGMAVFAALVMVADALDGFAARKHKTVSAFGAALDQIFDKVIMISVFALLGAYDALLLPTMLCLDLLRHVIGETVVQAIAMHASVLVAAVVIGRDISSAFLRVIDYAIAEDLRKHGACLPHGVPHPDAVVAPSLLGKAKVWFQAYVFAATFLLPALVALPNTLHLAIAWLQGVVCVALVLACVVSLWQYVRARWQLYLWALYHAPYLARLRSQAHQ